MLVVILKSLLNTISLQRYEKLLNYTLIYQKISISTYSLHGNLLCDLLSVDASGCT